MPIEKYFVGKIYILVTRNTLALHSSIRYYL